MTGVLITFDFASMVFLIWAFAAGFHSAIRIHILIALGSTAFSVFSHSMTMMYVAAVGRMIRQTVEKGKLDQKYVNEAREYRSTVFRIASLAMILVMLQTVLGGGVHTRALPAWSHLMLGSLAVPVNGYAVLVEVRCLIANHLLGHRVARDYETADTPRRD